METVHNPDRFMADLRQILSQGRKRIGLLIGAGAPMSIKANQDGSLDDNGSPLIPGVDELTRLVIDGLEHQEHRSAAQAVRAELRGQANIETILSRIRLLETALGEVQLHGLNGLGYAQLGEEICRRIGQIVRAKLPQGRTAYSELVAWINGTLRPNAIEIFTTNYDLLFEEAFERSRVSYFDGFTGGSVPFFDPVTVAGDDLPPRWARLWKLHGSIGWRLDDGAVVRTGGRGEAQLIYPDHMKYDLTKKQPYASLFERLKRFLLEPDTLLLTTGFSFRDAHICAVLDEALSMNKNAAVFAFQFSSLAKEDSACRIAYDRPNMSVYAADGAVINGVEGNWRPGELPKNWTEIRASFWGCRGSEDRPMFLLGDFSRFARFCALSQATDLQATSNTSAQAEDLNTEVAA